MVQERATAVSHSATSRHARELGDPVLADICMAIANDERRHELAYTRIVDEMWNLCALPQSLIQVPSQSLPVCSPLNPRSEFERAEALDVPLAGDIKHQNTSHIATRSQPAVLLILCALP